MAESSNRHDMIIFSGNANRELAQNIAQNLDLSLGRAIVGRFSDGEIQVELIDNVRGKDVFIVQPTCAPCNENLMELLVMIDAVSRASARRITSVIPYYGYARQDRRTRSIRVPITAKLVAKMLESAKTHRVLTVDLHADQIQGFFDVSIDNIYASPILLGDIWMQKHEDLMVVSPDVGGVVRARQLAMRLEAELAIIDKRRPKPNVAKVMNIIGEVEGRTCVMIDDLVDTAGTLCKSAQALKDNGAKKVVGYCTHAVLSGAAIDNIENSELDELVVTDTIPLSQRAQECGRIRQLSISQLLAETMRRIHQDESISELYTHS